MPVANAESAAENMRRAGLDVSTDPRELFGASLDHSRFSVLPSAVVFARKISDIGTALKIANECRAQITVRGSGTGCCGGAVPVDAQIVLDISNINFVEIDPVARVAHVGAGAINADVDVRARKFGLFYPPDPSSHKYCSIGGNIACNAGGLRALKYGTTRDNVLALSAFSAEGEFLKCALPLKKFSAGLNLRDLFIGSEGLLGVVAEAWLKLLPVPQAFKTLAAFFESDFDAFDAVATIMQSGLRPCVLEFMDALTISCVAQKAPELNLPKGKSALLVEFDGTPAEAEADAQKCAALFADARAAKSEDERQKLWEMRRKASSAMYLLADSKVNQDIVLPHDSLGEYFRFYKALGQKCALPTPVFGHSGDDNYHIHFMYNSAEDGAKQRARAAMEESVEKVIELGGAVSGEHGIGFLKSKYMKKQHSAAELEMMRRIKCAFDPNGILNSGKMLWENPLAETLEPLRGIKLPWD